jgi:hypothetical protein
MAASRHPFGSNAPSRSADAPAAPSAPGLAEARGDSMAAQPLFAANSLAPPSDAMRNLPSPPRPIFAPLGAEPRPLQQPAHGHRGEKRSMDSRVSEAERIKMRRLEEGSAGGRGADISPRAAAAASRAASARANSPSAAWRAEGGEVRVERTLLFTKDDSLKTPTTRAADAHLHLISSAPLRERARLRVVRPPSSATPASAGTGASFGAAAAAPNSLSPPLQAPVPGYRQFNTAIDPVKAPGDGSSFGSYRGGGGGMPDDGDGEEGDGPLGSFDAEAKAEEAARGEDADEERGGAAAAGGAMGQRGESSDGLQDEEPGSERLTAFEALMARFAAIDFPRDKVEPCPICQRGFALAEFAQHVYRCLALRDVADKTQVEEDEKVAILLAAYDGDIEAVRSSYDPSRPRGAAAASASAFGFARQPHRSSPPGGTRWRQADDVPRCESGAACQRADADHFRFSVHPEGHPRAEATERTHPPCPVCGLNIPLPILSDHANRCVDQALPAGPARPSGAPALATGTVVSSSSPSISSGRAGAELARDPAAPSFGAFRDASDVDGGAGGDENEPSAAPSMDDDEEAAPRHHISTEQMAAYASLALEMKRSASDPAQYLNLLRGFESLGFTEEALRQRAAEADLRSRQWSGGAASAGAGAGASAASASPTAAAREHQFAPSSVSSSSASLPPRPAEGPSAFASGWMGGAASGMASGQHSAQAVRDSNLAPQPALGPSAGAEMMMSGGGGGGGARGGGEEEDEDEEDDL